MPSVRPSHCDTFRRSGECYLISTYIFELSDSVLDTSGETSDSMCLDLLQPLGDPVPAAEAGSPGGSPGELRPVRSVGELTPEVAGQRVRAHSWACPGPTHLVRRPVSTVGSSCRRISIFALPILRAFHARCVPFHAGCRGGDRQPIPRSKPSALSMRFLILCNEIYSST